MRKDKIIKLCALNGSIILINIILFSNAFLQIDIFGGSIFSMAFGITAIFMSIVVFIYGNSSILFKKEVLLRQTDIKGLDDCITSIHQNMDKKTFTDSLESILEQINRFKKKKYAIQDILLQKFSETEMSYINFKNVLDEVEKVIYLNIRSILNRISAFDDYEYTQIRKGEVKKRSSRHTDSKLAIYNEYIEFVDQGMEMNEQIILKLDKLLLEISKFNSFEDDEIENMDAMQEIDELINNVKWYR